MGVAGWCMLINTMPLPQENPAQRVVGFGFVILLHIGIIYVLSSGLSHTVIEVMKGPFDAKIIEEIKQKEEEPPPPPPKFEQPPPPYVPPPEISIDMPVETTQSTAITQVTTQIKQPPPAPAAPKPQPTAPHSDPKHPNSRPDYPPTSRRLGEEGTVVLSLYVKEDGKVGEGKIQESSGFAKLDEAALREALRRWHFIPATLEGKAVAGWYPIKVTFKLTGEE